MTTQTHAPLKDSMGPAQLRELSAVLQSICARFDTGRFLSTALDGLETLTLMKRVRRASDAVAAGAHDLPGGYEGVLALLMEAAPRLGNGFMSLVAPDYVGQHGRQAFERSMDALKFFTPFGTSEFAVREFLRDDLPRALEIMTAWSRHPNDAVRRLASEGTRPRLPWSFRLGALEASPALAAPILDNLRADPSLYVRRSVANHLNDITKANPAWVLARAAQWGIEDPHTRWIIRHALRTLVKQGSAQALAMLGAESTADIEVDAFQVTPARLVLGDTLTLACTLRSTASAPRRLIVLYRIGYVRRNGARHVQGVQAERADPGTGPGHHAQPQPADPRLHDPHALRRQARGAVVREWQHRRPGLVRSGAVTPARWAQGRENRSAPFAIVKANEIIIFITAQLSSKRNSPELIPSTQPPDQCHDDFPNCPDHRRFVGLRAHDRQSAGQGRPHRLRVDARDHGPQCIPRRASRAMGRRQRRGPAHRRT